MVDINLLPWRVYLREYRKIQLVKYAAIFLFIVLSLLLGFNINLYYKISTEKANIAILQKKQNHHLSNQKANHSSELLSNLLLKLQTNHQKIRNFFEKIGLSATGDIIWKNILNQNGDMMLVGEAQSLPALLNFVKPFDGVSSIYQADIVKIKSLPNSNWLQFSLRFDHALIPVKK